MRYKLFLFLQILKKLYFNQNENEKLAPFIKNGLGYDFF